MASLYMNRLSNEQRHELVSSLHDSQNGNCFICGREINLTLQASTIDIDHIEPTRAGGKDGPGNFGLTHESCNRSKQSSDLRVARVLASFDAIAANIAPENRSPNLGDILAPPRWQPIQPAHRNYRRDVEDNLRRDRAKRRPLVPNLRRRNLRIQVHLHQLADSIRPPRQLHQP